MTKGKSIDTKSASRIQYATAKSNSDKTPKGSFASRTQNAFAK